MLFAVTAIVSLLAAVNANVIGIDFGSDNMKVGLVSPGKFDIGMMFINPYLLLLTTTFICSDELPVQAKNPTKSDVLSWRENVWCRLILSAVEKA
jgi:molecular chaperone DnaK (HSP70)